LAKWTTYVPKKSKNQTLEALDTGMIKCLLNLKTRLKEFKRLVPKKFKNESLRLGILKTWSNV
jgi:hypothetical protein